MYNSYKRIFEIKFQRKTWHLRKDQTSLGSIPSPPKTLSFHSPQRTQKIVHSPTSHRKQPSLAKGHQARNWMYDIISYEFHELASPDDMVKVFLPLSTKNTTKQPSSKSNFLSQSNVFTQPRSICQVKTYTFLII